jgi:2,6-dihydroxypyridine 3-monooxygenase
MLASSDSSTRLPPTPISRQGARPRVAVVGGSLGGLTSALLLRDLGCEVDVYERSAARLSGFGAGIVVHEATLRYFKERAQTNLADICVAAGFLRFVDASGRLTREEPCPYEFTAWSTLYRNLLDLYGPDRYHGGCELIGFDQHGAGVELRFGDGRVEHCQLLVCADGIHSTARSLLCPEAQPQYAGYVGWRGTIEERRLSAQSAALVGDSITYGVIDRSHILSYPIPSIDGSTDRGERLINFVWYRNVDENGELGEIMTDRYGRPRQISIHPGEVQDSHVAELREAAAAQLPAAFAEMIELAEPFLQVIVDLTTPAMVFDRVCLLGDAAFAARPHAAAGTAKAAENAWKLVDALGRSDRVEQALREWEPAQLELGRRLVERSRQIGTRYQVLSNAAPEDPELRFGLYGPGK